MAKRNKAGFLLLLLGLFPVAGTMAAEEVMVSAAISLRDVLKEAWQPFEDDGGRIVLNTAGSGVLLRQILRGAPADLFISASPLELDELERSDMLVPGSRCTLASNRLVIIFPLEGVAVERFQDLPSIGTGQIAIGNPKTVPAGRYARAALTDAGLWKTLEQRLVYADNVRQAVEYVARGDVSAGLVYRTDATRFSARVRIGPEAPAGSHPPILYQAALLKDGPNREQASLVLALLKADQSRDVFRLHGFLDAP